MCCVNRKLGPFVNAWSVQDGQQLSTALIRRTGLRVARTKQTGTHTSPVRLVTFGSLPMPCIIGDSGAVVEKIGIEHIVQICSVDGKNLDKLHL